VHPAPTAAGPAARAQVSFPSARNALLTASAGELQGGLADWCAAGAPALPCPALPAAPAALACGRGAKARWWPGSC
jgi:hypothetical protein